MSKQPIDQPDARAAAVRTDAARAVDALNAAREAANTAFARYVYATAYAAMAAAAYADAARAVDAAAALARAVTLVARGQEG